MTSRDDAPTPGDAVLAAAVAVVLAGIIALSGVGSRTSPGAAAYLFAAGFGAVLLLRRAMPLAVIVLSILGTFAYYTLNLPAIGVALPVAAALYSTAERGRLRTSVISGAVVFLVSLAFRLRDDPQPVGYLLGTDAALNIAVIAAAIALGYAVRARRIQAAQQRQIDRLNREQSARDAEERLRTERESVSRELHDSVGHALSVISLQAGVGQDAVGRDDDAVAKALAQVRAQATSTLTDLRGLVKALRSGPSQAEDDTRHAHSLASIPSLVDDAAAAGLEVTADVDLAGAELSPAVDAAAFRVVQDEPHQRRAAFQSHRGEGRGADRGDEPPPDRPRRRPGPPGRGAFGIPHHRDDGAGENPRRHALGGADGGWRIPGGGEDAGEAVMIRVVLVDDQEMVRVGLKALAERDSDITVVGEAADGRTGLIEVRRTHPDVVLMDIRMPRVDGITATTQIVADPQLADVRVVVLTTFDEDENVLAAIRAGAAGYLLKDIAPGDLRQAIRVVAAGDSLLSPAVTAKVLQHLDGSAGETRPELLESLTAREVEVLARVARGESNAEMGASLHISPDTARTYVSRLLAKLGARDRSQLVVIGYESGLVRPGSDSQG